MQLFKIRYTSGLNKLIKLNFFTDFMDQKTKEDKQQSFARRDKLQSIEAQMQQQWMENNTYVANPIEGQKKFYLNFPYPYSNGRLHLGHAFSYTKTDFIARFKRLQGFNVMHPFAFHCTGMPISASAKKLARQFEQAKESGEEPSGGQYEILRKMEIPKEEIAQFQDPYYWIKYFPPFGKQDLIRFGAPVDWRRSFITTDANPYYNSFIEWQFYTLRDGGYLKFGKRPSIFSILDNQMCADHDRKSGEGKNPQEYTLIKIRIMEPEKVNAELAGKKVYMPAATLRPETMYGQTNCFVLPGGEYGVYEMRNEEYFICSERSMLNMAYQELTKEHGKTELKLKVKGESLVGLKLQAPLCQYEFVYALPMSTIKMDKGTGIVTSVPSDAPDDWATLRDLQKKPDYFKIQKEMAQFDPVKIIEIPGYGDLGALKACDEFHVKSMNDAEAIKKAKDKVYLLGFYEGVMLMGPFKGKKVQEAKPLVKQMMIQDNQAATYYEPEDQVISRSGDECIVAYCDQWYLCYDDEAWKAPVRDHIKNTLNAFYESAKNEFMVTIDWIKEWGCSRSFGLGTKLPWDKQYVIESLSDSTLYFAYYTIAHFLQSDLSGTQPGSLNIKPELMTRSVWDYIFLGTQYDESLGIEKEKLDQMRNEFNYWYPLDLRCSGKDLIKNHLTFSLLNHAAIFKNQPEKWTRAYFCNGYIQVDGEKMSKQLGNFKTLDELLRQFGADATRMACADAGDSLDDANFELQKADQGVLKVTTLDMYFLKVQQEFAKYRTNYQDELTNYFDQVFENQLKQQAYLTVHAFEEMRFRDALKYGFFMMTSIKDDYLINTAQEGPRQDLIRLYIELQCALMYPITAHFCEYAYQQYYLPLVSDKQNVPQQLWNYRMKEYKLADVNIDVLKSYRYLTDTIRQVRVGMDKFKQGGKKSKDKQQNTINKVTVVVAKEFYDWQQEVLTILNQGEIDEKGVAKFDWKAQLKANPNKRAQDIVSKQMQFASFTLQDYKLRGKDAISLDVTLNEEEFLGKMKAYIQKDLKIDNLEIIDSKLAQQSKVKVIQNAGNTAQPLKPAQVFE